MSSHRGARAGIGSTARRSALAGAVALSTVGALFWAACGGTTGHADGTGLTGADATVVVDAGFDAGVVYDAGLFDVNIPFGPLPDVAAPPEGGNASASGDGGYPVCPPWLPIDGTGMVADASDPSAYAGFVDFIPSYYTNNEGGVAPAVLYNADGGVVFSADGGTEPLASAGPCATYPWFPEFDVGCLNYQYAGSTTYPPYPPCNWAIGIGNATAGPGANQSRYDLCMNLYTCIQNSGCWTDPHGMEGCLCGPFTDAGLEACKTVPPTPTGACKDEIQAAFELPNLIASMPVILQNLTVYYDPLCGSDTVGLSAPCYASALLGAYNQGVSATPPARNCVIVDAGSH